MQKFEDYSRDNYEEATERFSKADQEMQRTIEASGDKGRLRILTEEIGKLFRGEKTILGNMRSFEQAYGDLAQLAAEAQEEAHKLNEKYEELQQTYEDADGDMKEQAYRELAAFEKEELGMERGDTKDRSL